MASLKNNLSEFIQRNLGLNISRVKKRGDEFFPPYVNEEFKELYAEYQDASMVSWQGMHDAYNAAKYVSKNKIAGDIVECGVWRGGVSALMKDVLVKYANNSPRKLWLFDTFEGMSDPTEYDFKDGRGNTFKDTLAQFNQEALPDGGNTWCRGEIDDVRNTMNRSANDMIELKFIKGMVEDTLEQSELPDKISILRLDTDFYESTKKEFEVLFPRLVKGGILYVDDFGSWAGARKATQEYIDTHANNKFAFFNNHKYGALIGIKVFE
jgi:hypothetical protein